MNPDGLLGGDDIRRLISEVADELRGAPGQRTIVMVGGSLLACLGLRDSTEDVDSVRQFDDTLRSAIRAVAVRHELTSDWLNDHATAFAPHTLDSAECVVLLDRPELRVLGAPLHVVFLMKLRRADPADLQDMRRIWPQVRDRFPSASAVVEAFTAAFPDEPDDEFLDALVVDELAKGGFDVPRRKDDVLRAFAALPPVDPERFRADLDAVVDPSFVDPFDR